MRTLILALAAAATLGLAAPASASDGTRNQACADCVNLSAPRGAAVEKQSQAQDFSSRHRRHWRRPHWRHHYWRHHYGWGARHCVKVWRYGRLVTVCR